MAEIAEWLDHLTLVKKVPGSKTTFRPVTKCEEDLPALSVTLGKKVNDPRGVATLRTRVALLD